MARKVQVTLTDDLDGGQAAETVRFGLDGRSYEIDLSARNATKLRKALEPFVSVARGPKRARARVSSSGQSRATQTSSPVDSRAVRAWAKSHRIKVSSRGRIPADVVAKFREAGN